MKENEPMPEKDRLKKDEDGIVFDRDAIDGQKEQRLPSVLKNCGLRRLSRDGFGRQQIRPES